MFDICDFSVTGIIFVNQYFLVIGTVSMTEKSQILNFNKCVSELSLDVDTVPEGQQT